MIYLDNAATTIQKPTLVADAMVNALSNLGNSGRGAHGPALEAGRQIYAARQVVGALFHFPKAERVIFTSGSTEALNMAIGGLLSPGDHVISTDWEHNSVLRPLYRLEQAGTEVSFLPAEATGRLQYEKLERLLQKNTRALVCTHCSNLTGDMIDTARMREFCRCHGLVWIVDCSQSAGCMPLDFEALGADVLCFTGHKGLMGPQGTGGLCLRPGLELRPWKVGGTGVQTYRPAQPEQYPTHLEAGTCNGHGIAGLHAAVDFLRETGVERVHAHCLSLARMLQEGLRSLPGVTVYGQWDTGDRGAIVAMNFQSLTSGEAADLLYERYEIAVRPGAHCAPRFHRALGTVEQGIVRFSVGYYNKEEEICRTLEAAKELACL